MRVRLGAMVVAGIAVSVIGAGCGVGCDSSALPAVVLDIDEPGGPYTEPIVVRYRVDGGEWTTVGVDDDSVCTARTRCEIGYELIGEYEIEVSRSPARATVFTSVNADRCHVRTETIPVMLPEP